MTARSLTLVFLVLTMLAGSALAQIPDKFTNLEVFPPDIGKRELIEVMKDFSSALGVKCHHCHEMKVPGDFGSIDWASDSLTAKEAARGMMRMTGQLNNNLLPLATGEPGGKVRCITCHRGLADPRTLDLVLLETIELDGADASVARYRTLREKYYGSGSYDFGPMVLVDVATTLGDAMSDPAGALTVLDLNTEMYPDHSISYFMKGKIMSITGDNEGAMANAKKALELDPESQAAAKLLEQLKVKEAQK